MWHGMLKSMLCWNLRGKALWGKGLNDMCDEIKSYLSEWYVDQIMRDDVVNASVDPLGLYPGPPNQKVADPLL